MDAEERNKQIEEIIGKLPTLSDTHILNIADNIWWEAKKFYDPTKEAVISREQVHKIMRLHPELLV